MEFISQHPLGVLHVISALTALISGALRLRYGWRGQSGPDGRGSGSRVHYGLPLIKRCQSNRSLAPQFPFLRAAPQLP